MNISTETIGRLLASGRGYAQAGIGALGMLGILSAANQKGLSEGFADIFAGIGQMVHGFTSVWQISAVVAAPFISIALARWSSITAKTANQAVAVQKAVLDPNTPVTPAVKETIITTAKAV